MKFNLPFVVGISLISALAGFLFGYDWIVIRAAAPFYERFFEIVRFPGMQGLVMHASLLGCVGGAIISGWITEQFGRRGALMTSSLLFLLSAIGVGVIESIQWFILFRITAGISLGIALAVTPVYITEVSPAPYRGRMVVLNQASIVLGILVAQLVNFLVVQPVPEGASDEFIQQSWNGQMGWRWLLWAEVAPSSIFLTLLFFIPESPRWLAKASRWEKSEWVLQMIGGDEYARRVRMEIKETLPESSSTLELRMLISKRLRPVILLGVLLALLQQWCGIHIAFERAGEVFSAAGYQLNDIILNIVIIGSVILGFTLLALPLVDRWGRRRLMLTGAGGLTLVYILLGFGRSLPATGPLFPAITMLSIALYSMAVAPVVWVVIPELFPNRLRGVAMALVATIYWLAGSVLVFLYPYLERVLDPRGPYWIFGAICAAGFLILYRRLPETGKKTLEEIEKSVTS